MIDEENFNKCKEERLIDNEHILERIAGRQSLALCLLVHLSSVGTGGPSCKHCLVFIIRLATKHILNVTETGKPQD